jgi:hypothetical protein
MTLMEMTAKWMKGCATGSPSTLFWYVPYILDYLSVDILIIVYSYSGGAVYLASIRQAKTLVRPLLPLEFVENILPVILETKPV